MPGVREEGASGGFGEVGRVTAPGDRLAPRLTAGPRPGARPFRERSGAGWGTLSTPLPARAWPGRCHIAKLGDLTRDGRSTHQLSPVC